MTSSNFSRRNFLKGAGLAAIGAAGATTLAGCGMGTTVTDTSVDERTQAITTPDWLGTAPEIPESKITETLETEVLVVGCSTGGLPACISAAENGAKVLGIDRQAAAGSNVREDIGALNSRYQKEAFAQYPQFEISERDAVEDIVRYANGFVRYDLIKLWAQESGAMLDWIADIAEHEGKFKMWLEGSTGTESDARDRAYATGHSPAKVDPNDKDLKFGKYLAQYAESLGVEFRTNTALVKCEQDASGRVTGIIASANEDQHYIRINASKGVIISTGGYGNNTQMMETRQSFNQSLRISTPGKGGNPSGQGIKAALWCGARMDPLGAAVTFNRACVKPDEYAGTGNGEWFWFGEQPMMKVNLLGKRFCNESGPYDYMLHSAFMQPHNTYVDIWDSDYAEQVRQMNEVGCCRLYPFDNGAPSNRDISTMPKLFEDLEQKGYIQKADTIEELAKKLNLPVDTTTETFNHYNQMAEAGQDTDYFKESFRLMALKTPPYYGVRTGAWFLATIDGCIIDTNMHPLDEDENPIEGLYLTGNDSGGFFSVSYPNLFTGLACGRTMTFGKRAGMLAATGQA